MYYDDIRLNQPFLFRRGYFHREEHDIHVHDILEVGLVNEHEVSYKFGDRTYTGKPGDVFVCRPFEPHWGISPGERKARWSMLLFVPSIARLIPGGHELLVPFYTEWLPSPVIRADSPQAGVIAHCFERALRSAERAARRHESEQFLCLLEILHQIHEYASEQSQPLFELKEVPRIIQAVNYLLQHFTDEVPLGTLMELSGERRSRFFEKFQSFTGTSPNQFLVRLRIQHAMHLLHRFPESSILSVCEDSGFQSLRTFNKQFKSYTGVTPTEYRRADRD